MIGSVTDSDQVGGFSGPVYLRHGWLFGLSFALLISHEMDAMIRQEWLLLPGADRIADQNVADAFNLAHVPILTLVIWLVSSARPTWRERTMMASEVFIVGHAVAHMLLRGGTDYRFEAPMETVTVYGAAVAGAIHLVLALLSRRGGRAEDAR